MLVHASVEALRRKVEDRPKPNRHITSNIGGRRRTTLIEGSPSLGVRGGANRNDAHHVHINENRHEPQRRFGARPAFRRKLSMSDGCGYCDVLRDGARRFVGDSMGVRGCMQRSSSGCRKLKRMADPV